MSETRIEIISKYMEKNKELDDLIAELKTCLKPIQISKRKDYCSPRWPVGLIVGSPRSGSTLFLQWIASLGVFAYSTNILTRFAFAPYFGALIQKMLFDPKYDIYDQLKDIQSNFNFESMLGKSVGALNINEFQLFFREYIPFYEPQYLSDRLLSIIDTAAIRKDLTSIESAFGKPFVTKGTMLQYNINYFCDKIPELFIMYCTRDPIYVMQSILKAREISHGNSGTWWSVKPYQYKYLKDMDIYHQIAGQVYYTEKSISNSLDNLPRQRKITISYEGFCEKPDSFYSQLIEKYNEQGYIINEPYRGPKSFTVNNKMSVPFREVDLLRKAYEDFNNNKIKLD